MTIKLEYILKRNKSNLETFIRENKLTSYKELLEYCEIRKFIPCSEQEYNEVSKISKISEKIVTKKTETKDERKVSRKTSKTQEPKKRRYRRKKQQDTSKLSDSSDNG